MFQILITDDDKHTRHYLSALLTDAGYTPRCASSAGEALKLIKELPFDLLIVDVMMPSCFPPGSFRIISSTAFWPERTTI